MEGTRIFVHERFQSLKNYFDLQDHSVLQFITLSPLKASENSA